MVTTNSIKKPVQSISMLLTLLSLIVVGGLAPLTTRPIQAQAATGDMALLIVDGVSYREAVRHLERIGARVRHVFPPNALIGQVPWMLSGEQLAASGVAAMFREPVNPDDAAALGASAQQAAQVWNDLLAAQVSAEQAGTLTVAQAGDELVGDALQPPDLPSDGQVVILSDTSSEPDFYHASEFMIGTVAVGIILPESNGSVDPSTEDWTTTERQQVYSEIVAATNWWAALEPAAHLTFVYDDHFSQPVPTSYEPINRPQSEQNLWIGEVMANLGYSSTTAYFMQVRNYINDLRQSYHTDWAFAIFVVDSSNDVDNYFANGYFAYAYLGGPFMVMTYGNNGYGIHNMDAVAAHEMGHIFLALDQYSAARTPCETRAGYLNVENQNSQYGACASNVSSIMRGQVWPYTNGSVDFYARGQIGWWDGDGDGILDPVDTTTEVTLARESGEPIVYSGTARDLAYPSERRPAATINRITGVDYRLEDGDWQAATPVDGHWDSIQEPFTFSPSSLSQGIYRLDLRVRTAYGGDRLFDAIETVVVVAPGSEAPVQALDDFSPNPTVDVTPTYTGVAATVDATVTAVEFRVDGGNWQPAQAVDGLFDEAAESFTFTTPALAQGSHVVEVRASDSSGRVASSLDHDEIEVLQAHTLYLPAVIRNR
ncbi:MAG: hypothetical protein ACOYZ7_14175 [Chloroflexota bacterium]